MPWLDAKDPYKIWISEIILQQTRVDQGWSYYERFLKRFPNLLEVYHAGEEEILKYWEGLGYYSRARNLYRCAVELVDHYNGKFPDKAASLEKLPGIGPYTAAAIASFAIEEPTPVLDGNVFRVISRLLAIPGAPDDVHAKKEVITFLQKAILFTKPSQFNQALMNFGALVCKPVTPACDTCPFQHDCEAFQLDQVVAFPAKKRTIVKKIRHFHYFIMHDRNSETVLLQKRNHDDIWKNLYEFPLIETVSPELPSKSRCFETLHAENQSCSWPPTLVKKIKQKLTHQEIHFHIYSCSMEKSIQTPLWVSPHHLRDYPMPVTLKKVCQKLFNKD